MQFRGHSLPVHQSMSVSWAFTLSHFVSQSADAISFHNCHRNVSLPSGASLWNSMFGRVEGQYVTHWELCKKFKFDQTNKWYMHNPASVRENNTHKLLLVFDIHTDHQISARRPDPIIINKKKIIIAKMWTLLSRLTTE